MLVGTALKTINATTICSAGTCRNYSISSSLLAATNIFFFISWHRGNLQNVSALLAPVALLNTNYTTPSENNSGGSESSGDDGDGSSGNFDCRDDNGGSK